MKYVNVRLEKNVYGSAWNVQGQRDDTYNWQTIRSFGVNDKEVAMGVAIDTAKSISETAIGMVQVYYKGYSVISFVRGKEYHRGLN